MNRGLICFGHERRDTLQLHLIYSTNASIALNFDPRVPILLLQYTNYKGRGFVQCLCNFNTLTAYKFRFVVMSVVQHVGVYTSNKISLL